MIFRKAALDISKKSVKSLIAGFNRVVDFLEQGGTLSLQVLAELQQQMSEVIAKNKELRTILEQADRGKEFFHVNVYHPDAGVLNLPWGMALDPVSGRMLSEVPQVFLSKNALSGEPAVPEPAAGPLKILVMISSPRDVQIEGRLHFEEEERQVLRAFEPLFRAGEVQVDFTDNGSLEALREKVERNDYHILHFSGHGDFDEEKGEGYVLVEDPVSLKKEKAEAREFSEALVRDGNMIPLVVMSSCRTARAQYEKGAAGFTGKLMAKGIPAVVSMGLSIKDRYATSFAAEFYAGLAAKQRISKAFAGACTFTRELEAGETLRAGKPGVPLQWLIPQLYLSSDLRLLDWEKPFERLIPRGTSVLFANTTMEKARQESEQFVGRRQDLAEIMPVLNKAGHVLLKGQGGIGKTTLARKLVQRFVAAKPQAIPFIYNEEGKEFTLDGVLAQLIRFCLLEDKDKWLEALEKLEDDLVSRITFLYEKISREQPLVLVFDNIESFQDEASGDIRVDHTATLGIIRYALGSPGIYTVVTGRYPLKEVAGEVEVFDLCDIELNDFIRKCYNLGMGRLTQRQMEFLYTTLGGNFRYLEFFHRAFGGEEGNLDKEFLGLEAFQAEVEKYSGDVMREMAENIVFDKLWARLGAGDGDTPQPKHSPHSTKVSEQDLAVVLAHYELPVLEVALRMQGFDPLPMNMLARLRDLTLIQVYLERETEFLFFFMPPLVRGLMARRGMLPEMGTLFHNRAGEYHYYMFLEVQEGSIAELDAAFGHFHQAENRERIDKIGDDLADYYYRHAFYPDGLRVCGAVEEVYGETLPWWCCNRIGLIMDGTGNYDIAMAYYQRGMKMLEVIAEPTTEDLKNKGVTLNNISQVYKARGDLDSALKYQEQSLVIRRQVGDIAGEALTCFNMAQIFEAQGKIAQAISLVDRTVEIDTYMKHPDLESDTLYLLYLKEKISS